MTSPPASTVEELLQRAQLAANAGRVDDADSALQRVLDLAPNHAPALSQLGLSALRKGDVNVAIERLQRAAELSPKNPLAQLNLAAGLRARGDGDAELAALDQALKIDPYFYPAMLAKGALLERSGKTRQAAQQYGTALRLVPPAANRQREFNNVLARAGELVTADRAQLASRLRTTLANVRVRHAASSFARFDECLDIRLGYKKPYFPQPTMLFFPGVPPIQFYNNEDFAWLPSVEEQTPEIRDELLTLLGENHSEFAAYVNHPDGAPVNQWAELNRSPRWSAYFLWQEGARIERHCEQCPKTVSALSKAPLAAVPGRAPSVFFSTLDPKTRIPPHTGVTNTRLVVHVPLIVPPGCGFRVGNETREWHPGKAWVFDDSIEHEAWNDSDKLRVILIFDIWNPHLSEAERELVGALLDGIRDYYADGAAQ